MPEQLKSPSDREVLLALHNELRNVVKKHLQCPESCPIKRDIVSLLEISDIIVGRQTKRIVEEAKEKKAPEVKCNGERCDR